MNHHPKKTASGLHPHDLYYLYDLHNGENRIIKNKDRTVPYGAPGHKGHFPSFAICHRAMLRNAPDQNDLSHDLAMTFDAWSLFWPHDLSRAAFGFSATRGAGERHG